MLEALVISISDRSGDDLVSKGGAEDPAVAALDAVIEVEGGGGAFDGVRLEDSHAHVNNSNNGNGPQEALLGEEGTALQTRVVLPFASTEVVIASGAEKSLLTHIYLI